ncbi:MAG: type II toxin-antitoxin system Phd/YefM family antitoxin [Terriglobia bacterium]
MEQVAISEFKAKCLALLEQVRKTRKPICVTRFGKPVAEVVPPSPASEPADWLGSLADTMEIRGDIVSPVIEDTD